MRGDVWQIGPNEKDDGYELYLAGETLTVDWFDTDEFGFINEARSEGRVFRADDWTLARSSLREVQE